MERLTATGDARTCIRTRESYKLLSLKWIGWRQEEVAEWNGG